MKNRVAVVGGAGFLGSHLCTHLLNHGSEVLCIDNLHTGRASNLDLLYSTDGFEFLEKDVRKLNAVDLEGISQIYNLACPASPPKYQDDPFYTLDVCYTGTLNLLDLAQTTGSTLLHASTSEVYGDPEVHPQTESYLGNVNTVGPRACYDEGKRITETLCYEHFQKFGTRSRIVRIFNTYGPKMDPNDGRVISNFIRQSLSGKPHTIYGSGKQTRSFCYVADMILGFEKIMNLPDDFVPPTNLGTEMEYSVNQLSEVIADICGVERDAVYRELPQNDPKLRKPDLTRAQTLIAWSPEVKLRDGLRLMINDFKEN